MTIYCFTFFIPIKNRTSTVDRKEPLLMNFIEGEKIPNKLTQKKILYYHYHWNNHPKFMDETKNKTK